MALFTSPTSSLSRDSVAQPPSTSSSSPGIRPRYTVKETTEAWDVTISLPGVAKEGLTITDEEGSLTIRGERSWTQPETWTSLYRESSDLPFQLSLDHDNSVDSEKIQAELKEGILRLSLPKTEARKPRKISVT